MRPRRDRITVNIPVHIGRAKVSFVRREPGVNERYLRQRVAILIASRRCYGAKWAKSFVRAIELKTIARESASPGLRMMPFTVTRARAASVQVRD